MGSMNKFFLFFLLAAALVLPAAKVHSATFSDLDRNRIVYAPQLKSKFLVVDKIDKDQDQLQCHVFGKSAKVTVSTYDVNKTPFYETTSTMVRSQYAL